MIRKNPFHECVTAEIKPGLQVFFLPIVLENIFCAAYIKKAVWVYEISGKSNLVVICCCPAAENIAFYFDGTEVAENLFALMQMIRQMMPENNSVFWNIGEYDYEK